MGFFDRFRKKKVEEESSYNLDDISEKLQSKNEEIKVDAIKNMTASEVETAMDEYDNEAFKEVEVKYGPYAYEEVFNERELGHVEVPTEAIDQKQVKLSYFEEVVHEIMDAKLNDEQIKDLREAFEIKYAPIKDLMNAFYTYVESGDDPDYNNPVLIRLLDLLPEENENVFLPYYAELKELGLATDEEIKEIRNKYGSGELFKLNYTQGALYLERLGIIDIDDPTIFERSFDKNSIYKRHLIKIVSNELNAKDKEKSALKKI